MITYKMSSNIVLLQRQIGWLGLNNIHIIVLPFRVLISSNGRVGNTSFFGNSLCLFAENFIMLDNFIIWF